MSNYNYLGLYPPNESVLMNRALSPILYTNSGEMPRSLQPYKLQGLNNDSWNQFSQKPKQYQTTVLNNYTKNLIPKFEGVNIKNTIPKTFYSPKTVKSSGYANEDLLKTNKINNLGKTSNIISGIGNITDSLKSGDNAQDSGVIASNQAYDATAKTVSSLGPIGAIIGGGMMIGGAVANQVEKNPENRLRVAEQSTIGDKFFASKWSGMLMPGLKYSAIKNKETVEGADQNLANSINTGYSASIGDATADFTKLNQRISKKAREAKRNFETAQLRVNTENAIKSNIINKAKQDNITAMNNAPIVFAKNQEQLENSKYLNILSSKKGSKFLSRNVIPSGALHARKHNITTISKITNKGIPIVIGEITEDDIILAKKGDKIEQVAEIEKNELTLTLEVTNELEAMWKDYKESKKDSILIRAGKFLTKQILHNTDDNTDLISTIDG